MSKGGSYILHFIYHLKVLTITFSFLHSLFPLSRFLWTVNFFHSSLFFFFFCRRVKFYFTSQKGLQLLDLNIYLLSSILFHCLFFSFLSKGKCRFSSSSWIRFLVFVFFCVQHSDILPSSSGSSSPILHSPSHIIIIIPSVPSFFTIRKTDVLREREEKWTNIRNIFHSSAFPFIGTKKNCCPARRYSHSNSAPRKT